MKSTFAFLITASLLATAGCTNNMCGDLTPNKQIVVDSINKTYRGILFAEAVPCEYGYLPVYLQSTEVADSILVAEQKISR
jgi:hypothetical protein